MHSGQVEVSPLSYAENKFPKEYEPTVFDNLTTTLKIDNHIISLGLW
jgi:GTPase SAR1 family protein